MEKTLNPTGENSNHKLAAVFDRRARAKDAMRIMVDQTPLHSAQLDLIDPDSRHANRKLLPENRGIRRTLVRSHIVFGLAGAWIGILVFLVLNAAGLPFVVDNPIAAFLVLLHVSTLSGLMLGGLFSLRPDQVPYLRAAQEALDSGQSVLVVHATSSGELDQARDVLEGPAQRVVATA